jgi:LysR family transcriptional regulator, hydrogen peroxide-inducible genes activator
MEMHQIRYFLAVESERNFSRAADRCNITQPALTRAIQKLEDELGGRLFNRPGLVELTELGRALFPRLQSAFREVAEARTAAIQLMRHKRQRLRLGVMCTIGPDRFCKLIEELHRTTADFEFELTEAKGTDVLAALVNDEIDIAVAGVARCPETVVELPLYRERYILAVPSKHRFATANTVSVGQLDGEDYIERLNCEFDEYFEALHGEWPVKLNLRYRSEREDWVQAMIRSGMGIAILPESFPLIGGIATTTLVAPAIERTISALTFRGRVLPPVARSLLHILTAHDWRECAH